MHVGKDARKVISALYDHYNKTGNWMGSKTLRNQFGPDLIDKLEQKYDRFFFRNQSSDPHHYELTIQGILASSGSEGDKELLYQAIALLRKKFYHQPEMKLITKNEFIESLSLDAAKAERLRMLLSALFHGYANTIRESEWKLETPHNIELLGHQMSDEKYIDHWIDFRYKMRKHQSQWSRNLRNEKHKFALWILVITQSWTLLFLTQKQTLFPSLIPITGCIWFSVFSIVHILRLFGIKKHSDRAKKNHRKTHLVYHNLLRLAICCIHCKTPR